MHLALQNTSVLSTLNQALDAMFLQEKENFLKSNSSTALR
jgi:hypothetical protein